MRHGPFGAVVVSLLVVLSGAPVLTAGVASAQATNQPGTNQPGANVPTVAALNAPSEASIGDVVTVEATIEVPEPGAGAPGSVEVNYWVQPPGMGANVFDSVRVTPADVEDGTATVTFELDTAAFPSGRYIHGVTAGQSGQFATLDVEAPPTATISFQDQESDGRSVVVDSIYLPEGGYAVMHDGRIFGGQVVGSVIGTSEYLEPGFHRNVEVQLFDVPGATFDEERLTRDQLLVGMAHQDTDGDEQFDFVATGGADDGAYAVDGFPVVGVADVSLEEDDDSDEGEDNGDDNENDENDS